MIKISNKVFYKRHSLEIEKFIKNKKALHIQNKNSEKKINIQDMENIYLDLDDKNMNLILTQKYERIVLTDVIEHHPDIYMLLTLISNHLTYDGKLILSSINSKYIWLIKLLEFFKLKDKNDKKTLIHIDLIENITSAAGLEYQKRFTKQIFPFKFLFVGQFINKLLELIFFQFNFGIKTYMIFRLKKLELTSFSKAIIIPAKNEEGNLQELVDRIPKFNNTEIIFAYGKSEDKTLEMMEKISKSNKDYNFKIIKQSKKGKANAVWEALNVIENDLIAILDADISVDPETLIEFFEILENNKADFVNGTRLVYEMEKNSMRYLNKIGNRFFQFFIGKILKEKLSDSLCGTKVFKKSYLSDLKFWQNNFWIKDPFGDFDLLFSAAYTGQKIVELPITYRERKYGVTQISRLRDGFKLLVYLLASFVAFNTSRDG